MCKSLVTRLMNEESIEFHIAANRREAFGTDRRRLGAEYALRAIER
jgi:hypothetical protein